VDFSVSSEATRQFFYTLPFLLVSLVLHELAHGWAAYALGDPTAKQHGRLSLNPIRHLELFGTAMLFLTFFGTGGSFFFGWAKPVPIAPWYFKHPQRGMMLVGAAGPLMNMAIAAVAGGLAWLLYPWAPLWVLEAISLTFQLNIILAAFNLIPLPPLDGSRVLGGLLPAAAYKTWAGLDRYAIYTMLIVLVLINRVPGLFDSTIGAVLDASYRLLPWG
jgi:Zn-dependent protease